MVILTFLWSTRGLFRRLDHCKGCRVRKTIYLFISSHWKIHYNWIEKWRPDFSWKVLTTKYLLFFSREKWALKWDKCNTLLQHSWDRPTIVVALHKDGLRWKNLINNINLYQIIFFKARFETTELKNGRRCKEQILHDDVSEIAHVCTLGCFMYSYQSQLTNSIS